MGTVLWVYIHCNMGTVLWVYIHCNMGRVMGRVKSPVLFTFMYHLLLT